MDVHPIRLARSSMQQIGTLADRVAAPVIACLHPLGRINVELRADDLLD